MTMLFILFAVIVYMLIVIIPTIIPRYRPIVDSYIREYKGSLVDYYQIFRTGEYFGHIKSVVIDDLSLKERLRLLGWLILIIFTPVLLLIKYLCELIVLYHRK